MYWIHVSGNPEPENEFGEGIIQHSLGINYWIQLLCVVATLQVDLLADVSNVSELKSNNCK